jgi:hypothetical protein
VSDWPLPEGRVTESSAPTTADAKERCPGCGGDAADNWFDRSLCPCADVMHTRCVGCGAALDGCEFEQDEEEENE